MTITTSTKPSFTPGPYKLERTGDGLDDHWGIRTKSGDRYVGGVWFWDDNAEDAERAPANATLFRFSTELPAVAKSLLQANSKLPEALQNKRMKKLQQHAAEIIAMAEGRA